VIEHFHINLKWKGMFFERSEPYRVRTGLVGLKPSAASMDTVSRSVAVRTIAAGQVSFCREFLLLTQLLDVQ
jgi:hypothetical protein